MKFGDHTVNPLKLANAKLQSDPGSAALKMMDCLFSTEELVNGNPSGITKSKDSNRRATVQVLDPERMKRIFGMYCTLILFIQRLMYLQYNNGSDRLLGREVART